MNSDLSKTLNMEQLLLDSETEDLRAEREAMERSLLPPVMQVEKEEAVLAGIMLKKNKFFMK